MPDTRHALAIGSTHWGVLHFTGSEGRQMCENMSLLSYLGLIFSLIAVTLFVIIYSYKKTKGANPNIVEELRQRSVDTYLAANTAEAKTNSQKFGEAATVIDRLSVETRV